MENHTNGYKHDDVTIQSCWDSDRLDLGRVNIMPSLDYLSEEASAYIHQAYLWSQNCSLNRLIDSNVHQCPLNTRERLHRQLFGG
jgi:hypothetical protein